MSTFVASVADSVDLIARGIEVEFRAELRKRFAAVAQQLVEEAAVSAAKNVTARVDTFRNIERQATEVHIRFNDKVLAP